MPRCIVVQVIRSVAVAAAVVGCSLPGTASAAASSFLPLHVGRKAIVTRLNHTVARSAIYSDWAINHCWRVSRSRISCSTTASFTIDGSCDSVVSAWVIGSTLFTQGVPGQCHFPPRKSNDAPGRAARRRSAGACGGGSGAECAEREFGLPTPSMN